ncbi:glycosyltransferase [Cellulosimicrobium cellulans]|nr:glycosyltransferase [Cellulosimicrobium cellulans]
MKNSPSQQKVVPERDFPPLVVPDLPPRRAGVRAAVILDEFSTLAFAPEWDQIPVDTENWRQLLDSETPDLLFVESAWNGNDGAWLYHVVGISAPRPALVDLVDECRARGIPTVFWNKEDPPHFEDFLDTARLFDFVFTTDIDCVAEYKVRLGHDRVGVLPFAAQARFHNPARPGKLHRTREIAFGGMYFKHKYPERRHQLGFMLPAASKYKLDIFSRHVGGNSDYEFPPPFDAHVRGSLTYAQMLSAYHQYRVFINVNSVVDSPSMCARRIFEVSASGAAVVSPSSSAISQFFPNQEIATVDDEAAAAHAFKALLRSEEYRQRQVHLAQRQIWAKHTYTHRVETVLRAVGVEDPYRAPSVSVIVPTIRPETIDLVLANAARQVAVDPELVILTHGFELNVPEIRARAEDLGLGAVTVLHADRDVALGEVLNRLVDAASGSVVSKMDDDDFYGPHYLADLMHAYYYSEAEVVGKAAAYIYFESRDATVISYEAHEHRYTDFVRGATLTGARDLFRTTRFGDLRTSEDSEFLARVAQAGGRIYAADRYNFAIHRRSLPGSHTWMVSDEELFASGRFVMTGRPDAHVSI